MVEPTSAKSLLSILLSSCGTLAAILAFAFMIWGPVQGIAVALPLAFLLTIAATLVARRTPLRPTEPGTPLPPPGRRLRAVASVFALILFASSFVALLLAWSNGVADPPALQERSHYTLVNHGAETEVSRLHYVTDITSASLGFLALLVLLNLAAVHRALYARDL